VRNAVHNLPVLGICGWSNSGKTTLIEQVMPELGRRGLRVAVVKHDAHGVSLDKPGKDSDRFFQAGADVLLQGPGQECLRTHKTDQVRLSHQLTSLAARYDLVLVEGHKSTPLPKIWLQPPTGQAPPDTVSRVLDSFPFDAHRPARLLDFLETWLPMQWRKAPLCACVLIGDKSRDTGRAGHLIRLGERTWLEHAVSVLGRTASRVVLVGPGEVPPALGHLQRLADVPDASGPMAGMLAAMRWCPYASWLVAACDLPFLSPAALDWLVSFRRPGVWAAMPKLPRSPGVEPLLAFYDARAGYLLEALVDAGSLCPADIAASEKVATPTPPGPLAPAWRNMNTPADIGLRAELA